MNMENESILCGVNRNSSPSDLRITDIRFTDIIGTPMHCTLLKIMTNQGITGYGEVRDGADRRYAAILKSRLIGENPCNVDRLFRRIKQFGGVSRQAGGVCGVEIALWDLAGKAYGVPVYQLIGGKFRDEIRMYCDTDIDDRDTGEDMGRALQSRISKGFTMLKMDLGIDHLICKDGTLSAPLGVLDEIRGARAKLESVDPDDKLAYFHAKHEFYDLFNIKHPFTGIHVTEKGLDELEEYLATVRGVIGDDIPLAIDHFGHIGIEDCIRLCRRIEKYNIQWAEDMVPWQYTNQYARLSQATTVPICTGEDIYLKENFEPLLKERAVSVIHPDVLSAGGILETKKVGDMAQEYGVQMALHMAETPIGCLAAAHAAAATENFIACEFHSSEVDWWEDMVKVGPGKPIVDRGFIRVSDAPGLGIEELNDEVLKEHLHPEYPDMWASTEEWERCVSNDRLWS